MSIRARKLGGKVIGFLFVIVGVFAGKKFVTDAFRGTPHDPVTTLTFALGMIALGGFYLWYIDKGYRGGAPTIIGAFLLVLGVFTFGTVTDAYGKLGLYDLFLDTTAGLIFLGFGVLLVRSGHKSHQTSRGSSTNEAT